MIRRWAFSVGLVLALGSCYGDHTFSLGSSDVNPPTQDQGGGMPQTGASDLPCDVAGLLEQRCASCHSNPQRGAPIPLTTWSELTATSQVDPQRTVAERSLSGAPGRIIWTN